MTASLGMGDERAGNPHPLVSGSCPSELPTSHEHAHVPCSSAFTLAVPALRKAFPLTL